jgi:hypothetical protein
MEGLRKSLREKADAPQVNADLENHEFKIGALDRNLVCIANDFETFQSAINKMHVSLVELQDANKDVLLGKRKLNCLSCGQDKLKDMLMLGHDGIMYKGQNAGKDTYDGMSTVTTLNRRVSTANTISRAAARTGTTEADDRFRKATQPSVLLHNHPPLSSEFRAVSGQRKHKLPFGFMVQ